MWMKSVHYSWVVHIYINIYMYIYIYAACIMIQCTEPATPAVIACSELSVSLQEAVLDLKTRSPITVLSERRRLRRGLLSAVVS